MTSDNNVCSSGSTVCTDLLGHLHFSTLLWSQSTASIRAASSFPQSCTYLSMKMNTLLWLALVPFWTWSRLSESYNSCHLITSLHWSSLSHLLHSSLSVHTGHSAFWVSASHLSTEVPNISICTHRQSDTNTDTPHFPVCVFHNVCVQLTFYRSLSAGRHLSLLHPSVISPLTVCYLPFCAFPYSLTIFALLYEMVCLNHLHLVAMTSI